jgi:hypothetical protein
VRTKQKTAVLVEQRLARDRTEAYHDARALAIELARGEPSTRFDPMKAGVVLQPGETVYRQVPLWIRVQQDGRWAEASYADVIVTEMRLFCRFATGRVSLLWWSGVVAIDVGRSSPESRTAAGEAGGFNAVQRLLTAGTASRNGELTWLLVAEDVKPADVCVVTVDEEGRHSLDHGVVLAPGTHSRILPELLRNHEEQVAGVVAQVALPEVEEVHVVDRRLAALDFHEDPGSVQGEVVIGTNCAVLVGGEEPPGFAGESELTREQAEGGLNLSARQAWGICSREESLCFGLVEVFEETVADRAHLLMLGSLLERGLHVSGTQCRHVVSIYATRESRPWACRCRRL